MEQLIQTPRTTLRRRPARGSYDRALVHSILDEALVCHVGFSAGDQTFVTPTAFGRIGDRLYIHGAVVNRTVRSLRGGTPVCITVTLLDGLVLARSAFHHSMNYRSVMIFGIATEVTDSSECLQALSAIVNHMVPGRSDSARPPTEQELKATSVLALEITEASAKVRAGAPVDDDEDYALPHWAGVIPMKLQPQPPIADALLMPGTPVPPEVASYVRGTNGNLTP